MKRAIIAAAALMSSTIMSTPSNAAVSSIGSVTAHDASEATLNLMLNQCTALAATNATNTGHVTTGVIKSGSVVAGTTPISGPSEVGTESDRTFTSIKTPGADSVYTPAYKRIRTDPFRNGGSVNMFGIQESVGGSYSTSTYDFTAKFKSTFAFAFKCDLSETIHTLVLVSPAVLPTPGTGHHYRMDGNTHAKNCINMDLAGKYFGVTGPGPGPDDPDYDPNDKSEGGTCLWTFDTQPTPGHDAVYRDDVSYIHSYPDGVAVNQDQEDTLAAHENNGAGYSDAATVDIGQVVICNSPGTKGGSWKPQNGYNGGVMGTTATATTPGCSTAWYNGGATTNVPNLNDGSHNWITVPVI